MKKIIKNFGVVILSLMLCMLSACGGGGNSDEKYVGKYVSVAGEAMGVTLTGEEISGFDIELKEDGKAVLTVDGDEQNFKWKNDGESIVISGGDNEMTGVVDGDTIVFDNMLDAGLKVTFAKEGTDAANPENYMSAEEKNMIGVWQSSNVTDILGDPVEDVAGDALKLEFNSDHTMGVYFDGGDCVTEKWSLVGDWGSIEGDDSYINWDITDDGISVNYIIGDEYYVFSCQKQ